MSTSKSVSRRDLLMLVAAMSGGSLAYPTMQAFGALAESDYRPQPPLKGRADGTSVLVLGAGMAGLVAAVELSRAGYKVQVLEYNDRPGGRAWTVRGGDLFTDLSGEKQTCEFASGLYFNPGPMRIAQNHHAYLDYCRKFGVALEIFSNANPNAYVHSEGAFGGKPQRFRHVQADFEGYMAELLAKAINLHSLDQAVSKQDLELLLDAMRSWGALDSELKYRKGTSSRRRGLDWNPRGGGMTAPPTPSTPLEFTELLRTGMWRFIAGQHESEFHHLLLHPVGGMDVLPKAMAREVNQLIKYRAEVKEIQQDGNGVTAIYTDRNENNAVRKISADWCVCTIPLSILGQLKVQVSPTMANAIASVYYHSSFKIGLQFKRRFWEQDDQIYGGISFTDTPLKQIVYPSADYNRDGPGILVSGFALSVESWAPISAFTVASMNARDRIAWSLREGTKIHPQFPNEFQNGFSVAWHRVPSSLGCFSQMRPGTSNQYPNLCAIDGRFVLAGEHISRLPGWQEGAILGSLDAITRLHERVISSTPPRKG